MDHKQSIPPIFLDTSIILAMAKAENGELRDEQRHTFKKLHATILHAAQKGKIICPKADQREEIDLGFRLWEESEKIISELSLGIRYRHRQEIKDRQIQRAMEEYIKGIESKEIFFEDAFVNEPERVLREQMGKAIAVHVYFPPNKRLVDLHKSSKQIIKDEQEVIRQRCVDLGITREAQLERELMADLDIIRYAEKRMNELAEANKELTFSELEQFAELRLPLTWWNHLDGKPSGLIGLANFYASARHKNIPTIDISSNLYAYALTSESPISGSDYIDIQFVAAYLPYADLMLVDKRTKNTVIQLGLDKKYQSEVYCQKDIPALIGKIQNISE